MFEELCGARLTYSYITVGGVIADVPPGWFKKVEAFLDQFVPVIDELHAALTNNAIFIRRTAAIGVLSPEDAIAYGCSGPVLRGSGINWDLRRDGEPIFTHMYEGYDFEVIASVDGSYPTDLPYPPVPREAILGDCWHRFYVRMIEVVQSMRLIRQGIEKYNKCGGDVGEPIALKKTSAAGRGVFGDRSAEGSDGIYDRQRRIGGAVANTGPQQQFLQPIGHSVIVPRRVNRGHACHRRLARHCIGGNRPVILHYQAQMTVRLARPIQVSGGEAVMDRATGYTVIVWVVAENFSEAARLAEEAALKPKDADGEVTAYKGYIEEADVLVIDPADIPEEICPAGSKKKSVGVVGATGLMFFEHEG